MQYTCMKLRFPESLWNRSSRVCELVKFAINRSVVRLFLVRTTVDERCGFEGSSYAILIVWRDKLLVHHPDL